MSTNARPVAITDAEIFSGSSEKAILGKTLLIERGQVTAVMPKDAPLPVGTEVLSIPGTTVMPGLIDLHVHLADWTTTPPLSLAGMGFAAAGRVASTLATGTTTVRDVGGPSGLAVSVREGLKAGLGRGSRVLAANEIICMTGGHGSEPPLTGMGREVDGEDACRQAVRLQLKEGADLIKVATNGPLNVVEFTKAELQAITDEAHRCGLKVACHASLKESVRMAIEVGVDTIEHGCDLDRESADAMARKGIILVPTLIATQRIMDDWERFKEIPAMRSLPIRAATHIESFQTALLAGVQIGVGTDTSPALGGFAALPDELRTMVRAGMSPTQALIAATRTGANAIDRSGDLGTLEPGAIADLVVCDGQPHLDIEDVTRVRLVMQAGTIVHGEVPGSSASSH